MCLIFIVQNQHPEYSLIIAANRDEFYDRASVGAHFWPSFPDILAGKDLVAGGSWLGLNKHGRFAAVTNYRESPAQQSSRSRGLLVMDFLQSQHTEPGYLATLAQNQQHFAGYNCLFGHIYPEPNLHYFSNRSNLSCKLEDGIHGLSNALLNTPWPKVTSGKTMISQLIHLPFNSEDWFALLGDNTIAHDHLLPDTGIGIEKERLLSSRFIRSAKYGTRTSTLITLDRNGQLKFYERSFVHQKTSTQQFTLTMTPS